MSDTATAAAHKRQEIQREMQITVDKALLSGITAEISPKTSPLLMVTLISFTAVTSPKCFVTFVAVIMSVPPSSTL